MVGRIDKAEVGPSLQGCSQWGRTRICYRATIVKASRQLTSCTITSLQLPPRTKEKNGGAKDVGILFFHQFIIPIMLTFC